MKTSHELAKELLSLPELPLVSNSSIRAFPSFAHSFKMTQVYIEHENSLLTCLKIVAFDLDDMPDREPRVYPALW